MILHYYEKGQKSDKVVLFIHGSASDATVWLREINVIASKGYHCYAIDLRGHGETKEKKQPLEHVKLDLDTHMHDVRETLIHLGILSKKFHKPDDHKLIDEEGNIIEEDFSDIGGIEPVDPKKKIIIVTHSFGGIIAINLAREFPELIDRLILVALPPRLILPIKTFLNFLLGKPLEVIQNNLDFFSQKVPIRSRYKSSITTNAHVLQEIFKHVKNWNCFDHASKLNCPVHLAAGRFDLVAMAKDIEKFHERLANSSYELFKWSSHALMEDEPEKFEKWLVDKVTEE